MIDSTSETLISMSEAAKSLPGRPSIVTLWRWKSRGVKGARLETIAIGGRRYTSREALARFIAATTRAADGEPIRSETPRRRKAAIERAEQRAAKLGV